MNKDEFVDMVLKGSRDNQELQNKVETQKYVYFKKGLKIKKATLISIRPQWVGKILNGIKKDEIRKGTTIGKAINKLIAEQGVAPMLIYCTKDTSKGYLVEEKQYKDYSKIEYELETTNEIKGVNANRILNGKVVARFNATAEEISYNYRSDFTSVYTDTLNTEDLEKQACLTRHEFAKYLKGDYGYAIHINDLEIFDKPKEISEFYKVGYENSVIATKKYILNAMNREERRRYKTEIDLKINNEIAAIKDNYKLTRAPQSFCFIEL